MESEKIEGLLQEIGNVKKHLVSVYEDDTETIFNRLVPDFEVDPDYEYPRIAVQRKFIRAFDVLNEKGKCCLEYLKSGDVTRDDWISHVLDICPLVTDLLKKMIAVQADYFKKDLAVSRNGFEESLARQQFQLLFLDVLAKSNCNIFEAHRTLSSATMGSRYPILSSLASYHGLVLLLELITESVGSNKFPEDMRKMVKEKVEEGYLLGALDYEFKQLTINKDYWERMVAKHTHDTSVSPEEDDDDDDAWEPFYEDEDEDEDHA